MEIYKLENKDELMREVVACLNQKRLVKEKDEEELVVWVSLVLDQQEMCSLKESVERVNILAQKVFVNYDQDL